MDAIFAAIADRADPTYLVLIAVIGYQQWLIRDLTTRVVGAMDRLTETLTALRIELAARREK